MSTPIPHPRTADTGRGQPAQRQRKVKHRRFDPWGAVAWIVGLGFFFPVFWMVLTAFKQEVDAYTTTPKLFFVPTLDEFKAVFDQGVGTGAAEFAVRHHGVDHFGAGAGRAGGVRAVAASRCARPRTRCSSS